MGDIEESIYHVEFEADRMGQYVLAPGLKQAHVILKRMFRAPMYDFEWENYSIEDLGHTNIESVCMTNEPPFSVLEAKQYQLIEHEKRVNGMGKGSMYLRRWNR